MPPCIKCVHERCAHGDSFGAELSSLCKECGEGKNFHPADCPGPPKYLPEGTVPGDGWYIMERHENGYVTYLLVQITGSSVNSYSWIRALVNEIRKGARFAPIALPEEE